MLSMNGSIAAFVDMLTVTDGHSHYLYSENPLFVLLKSLISSKCNHAAYIVF